MTGDIRRWNDPVSNSFPCQVCFRDAFGGACFPSGTHALMYATAVCYNMPTTADAIFAAEINKIARNFPAYDKKWNDRAEDLLWEIFLWKFDHVPSFTRRHDKSEGVNFTSHTYDNYWGTGHNGHGRNMYGKLQSQFRVCDHAERRLGYPPGKNVTTLSTQPSTGDTPDEINVFTDGEYSGCEIEIAPSPSSATPMSTKSPCNQPRKSVIINSSTTLPPRPSSGMSTTPLISYHTF